MTSIPRTTALALAAVLAAGCAAFDPNNLLSRQALPVETPSGTPVPPPASPTLDMSARMAALDFVWSTVGERYYDPMLNGTDWNAARERWRPRALAAGSDDEFWEALDHMTGELHDSHTRVESPARAARNARFESVTLGFTFLPLEGKLAVTSVHPGSDAFWAGVRPGMTLVEVSGEPARSAYARALDETRDGSTAQAKHLSAARRLLTGEPDTTATLAFARGDGTTFTATLKRQRFASPPRVTHRVLPSGLGYIRLTSWEQSMQGPMIEAIAALKGTPGIVIDLRGNPGGSALMVRNVAAQFFKGRIEVGRTLTRSGRPITIAFDWIEVVKVRQELEGTGAYLGPVVVLVNASSGSGSELFAGILQSQGRATIVGQTSCGCLLAFMGYAEVPGGGKLAYSEVGFVFPNGKRIEGAGVVPDVPVPLTIADLLVDRDRALEEAQAVLAGKKQGTRMNTDGHG
ncbi:MAG TPA: S41 family peptidase [Usitatibacteraceae bacterium]|nr:S41 family peptidase [Usitatibacteraceae bacterium]